MSKYNVIRTALRCDHHVISGYHDAQYPTRIFGFHFGILFLPPVRQCQQPKQVTYFENDVTLRDAIRLSENFFEEKNNVKK